MSDRPDNAIALDAAVDRWIEEAKTHPAGVFHLRRRASWLDDQLAKLAAAVDRDMRPPLHLQGLTVSDIHGAQARLLVAARDLGGESESIQIDGVLKDASIHAGFAENTTVARGRIYGDRKGRFPDGEMVWTSTILKGPDKDGIIQTRNSVYRLERAAS